MTKKPIVDPIQVFCSNFPSQLDMSEPESRWKSGNDTKWPKEFEGNISLKKSRYTLEVLNLVLQDSKEHLAKEVLEFYGPTPSQWICNAKLIASTLIQLGLSDISEEELEKQIDERVKKWTDDAIEKSEKICPNIKLGKTGWIRKDGCYVCWGKLSDGKPI